ncbi:MAG: hypothetical protein LiPW15_504 [Parcubacteria group bacterium LiPW_15]|nr:MAG: hypothetical protein LiPW15_504 [Parcubacteria group bacterium LiPW_15]
MRGSKVLTLGKPPYALAHYPNSRLLSNSLTFPVFSSRIRAESLKCGHSQKILINLCFLAMAAEAVRWQKERSSWRIPSSKANFTEH